MMTKDMIFGHIMPEDNIFICDDDGDGDGDGEGDIFGHIMTEDIFGHIMTEDIFGHIMTKDNGGSTKKSEFHSSIGTRWTEIIINIITNFIKTNYRVKLDKGALDSSTAHSTNLVDLSHGNH